MSRQRLGQHFLTSAPILERIAKVACGAHTGIAVEIGPGRGALTEHLLPRVDHLIAVELDAELAAALRHRFSAEPKFTLIEGDALDQDFRAWSPDLICGNLPYYVATPILHRVARTGIPAVALIQKEVAERISAQPGTRDYGFLTCEIGLFAEASYLFAVKPGSFRPQPQVDSAVIRLTPHARADEFGVDPEAFLRFLATCFHMKRKTLRNNLSGLYPVSVLDAMPEAAKRAEQCALSELAAMYQTLSR